MRAWACLAAAVALGACAATVPSEDTAGPPSMAEANAAFPDTDVAAIAACVRDNASEDELAAMAAGGTLAQQTTAAILGRPATAECLQASNVALPSAGG